MPDARIQRVGSLVLIVDDNQLERRYMAALLAADGFDVVQVERAVEGLVAVTAVEPALVILASGAGLAAEAKRVRVHQLVRVFRRITKAPVAIIGDPEPTDGVESLVSGGDLFLPRGFSASELISRSRMLVRRQDDLPLAPEGLGEPAAIVLARNAQSALDALARSACPKGRQAA